MFSNCSAALIGVAFGLQLDGLSTKKPRVTKYTMKPQSAVGVGLEEVLATTTCFTTNWNWCTCILCRPPPFPPPRPSTGSTAPTTPPASSSVPTACSAYSIGISWTRTRRRTPSCPTIRNCPATVPSRTRVVSDWNSRASCCRWASRRLRAANDGTWTASICTTRRRTHYSSTSIDPVWMWVFDISQRSPTFQRHSLISLALATNWFRFTCPRHTERCCSRLRSASRTPVTRSRSSPCSPRMPATNRATWPNCIYAI